MQATLERAMAQINSTDAKEKQAMARLAKRSAGFNTAKNLSAAADAKTRAKMQIAQALVKNQQMMNELGQSFESKLSESEKESAELLKSLGLAGISAEEMKTTPSLRNLNQDPTMADALVYYLAAGDTLITTPDDGDTAGKPTVSLSGGGMIKKHAVISFNRKAAGGALVLRKGAGTSFVNGQVVEEQVVLKHNDRLILGNAQAFRVVDPLDPSAKSGAQLIDWDLAQTELAEAMGTAVNLKVEEEVAKKKAELDEQLKAMEEKFARENEKLRQELASNGKSPAANSSRLKQMDARGKAIETFKAKARLHVSEYKRDLIRLEESLKKVTPLVKEANQMAMQLGRCVAFAASLVTYIPESHVDDPLSPVEELLTQKVTELMVQVTLHNPRTDMKREWYWQPEPFFDRIGRMREVWQKWMLEQVMMPLHVQDDPFWSAPSAANLGSAYLYLAPIAYCCPCSQWIPIVNHRGQVQGELRVHLKPTKPDMTTPLPPTDQPEKLLGKRIDFELTIEQARGLMDCPNKNVRVEYTFSDEEGTRTTPVCSGKKFDPKFNEKHSFNIPQLTERIMSYLCKDAICFEVWGEMDDVEETDVAEAVSMELPPETFEFFVSHDLRAADTGMLCAYKDYGSKNFGHAIAPLSHNALVLSIAQADKHFKVCDVGRFNMGYVREYGSTQALQVPWTPLKVIRQARVSESDPWVVEVDFPPLHKAMEEGKTYQIDIKCEVQEVERLGLEEGLEVVKTVIIEVNKAAVGEQDSETARRKRQRETVQLSEIYMGQFEVADAAVNLAMMNMRQSDAVEDDARDILTKYEAQVDQLKQVLVEECNRQYSDLALRAAPLGFELEASLALWQLPSELLGAEEPADVESLKRMNADLKQQLKAAKERIAYLEGATSASKAQRHLHELRKQMVAAKADGTYRSRTGAPDGSKACSIQ